MVIAIIGASGFLGSNFINYLIKNTTYDIRAISRHASSLKHTYGDTDRLTTCDADIFQEDKISELLRGCDMAYYFVHMMGQKNKDFSMLEAKAAQSFSKAASAAGIKRVIYLGGLGNDNEQLSPHLLSRHNTGTILRKNLPLVIEFRASMIIGEGSISYDIIQRLVHVLPIMTLPRWSKTKTQPLALHDALQYLGQAATLKLDHHQIIEIGGPTVLSYKELYRQYAHSIGRNPFIIRLPFLPEWLGGWWLNLFTPSNHAKVGRIMVHSMSNAMVVTNDNAHKLFPDIHPMTIDKAIKAAKNTIYALNN